MVYGIICLLRGRHTGFLGVNPKNGNTEVHCRRCGAWTLARGAIGKPGEFIEYYG